MTKENKIRKVFLDELPKRGKYINWKESVDYKIHFIYDDIEDDLEIIDYIKDNIPKITIQYKNNKINSNINDFKRCKIAKLLNIRTKDFKVEIGQTFKDDKRDITIIDREYRKDKDDIERKWYKYHCNKCKNEDWIIESHLLKGIGCNACCPSPKKVTENNCIYATDRWMMNLGVSEYDAKHNTSCSNKKIIVKCPLCKKEKKIKISDIYRNKSISCICGDNISYSEKFIMSLLEQLNINYIIQLSKFNYVWCNKYKYDFYFKLNNEEYILETNGGQHYEEGFSRCGGKTLSEVQQNDLIKKQLAIQNGIKEENYIILDCRKSKLEWIRNSILNSKLNKLFDLNKIDWIKCEEFALSNRVKEICDYWNLYNDINNEILSTKDLENIFKLNRSTITRYLKRGAKLRWCNYNPKKEMRKSIKKFFKQVEIFKNNVSLGVFESCSELSRQSEELFGIKLLPSSISKIARGEKSQYKGFTFKYVEDENSQQQENIA